jgi:phosphoribosylformylglycinamidine synthase
MGGSILYRRYGGLGGKVPEVDPSMLASNMKIVKEGIDKGIIRSCHDCSDGGLVIALAEMCIGGDLGFEGDLSYIPGADPVVKMFSESNSRFIVEVDASKEREWSSSAEGNVIRIGRVGACRGGRFVIRDGKTIAELKVEAMRKAWSEPMWRLLSLGGLA